MDVSTGRDVRGCQSRNVGQWSIVLWGTLIPSNRIARMRLWPFDCDALSLGTLSNRVVKDKSCMMLELSKFASVFSPHESGKCANLLTLDQRRLVWDHRVM